MERAQSASENNAKRAFERSGSCRPYPMLNRPGLMYFESRLAAPKMTRQAAAALTNSLGRRPMSVNVSNALPSESSERTTPTIKLARSIGAGPAGNTVSTGLFDELDFSAGKIQFKVA